jgi:hypothetical protein
MEAKKQSSEALLISTLDDDASVHVSIPFSNPESATTYQKSYDNRYECIRCSYKPR